MSQRMGIGIVGTNGHQIHRRLQAHPRAALVAACACPPETFATWDEPPRPAATLDALLADERVALVSLCTPRRDEQAEAAIRCLRAGRHVYAEKPCATSEAELDRLLEAAAERGRIFHEMAGTAFEAPYFGVRQTVGTGRLGTIVQVLAQKSYPYHDRRPGDEGVDGGLITQAGIHAVRMVEHVARVRVETVRARETTLGNPRGDGLRMAATLQMTLENGGLATVIANYLNPPATGIHGNEYLHLFGTRGTCEVRRRDGRTHLFIEDRHELLEPDSDRIDDFEHFLDEVLEGAPPLLPLEEEIHPTRIVLRAKADAEAAGRRG